MNEMTIKFNQADYLAKYNPQTGFYEIDIETPQNGGVYSTDIKFVDLFGQSYEDSKEIRIWAKEQSKIEIDKTFMWIFDYKDFSVKDIVEISDYEINIDEETNANTIIKILKRTTAKERDIIAIKKNNEIVYWGTTENIQNEDGKKLYEYSIKYITNIFDQNIKLEDENLIRTTGIEDFIARAITKNFIQNTDEFINKTYLQINIKTHTKLNTGVTNVEDGIYNLHTYMTNCTQKYDVVYDFEVNNKTLVMTIEVKALNKELIDIQAQPISKYSEVFEKNVVSKVVVLTSTNTYTLYLLNDRTTTTNMNDPNRADGKIETIYTEKYEDAPQKALDTMKANRYNHNITFNYYNRFIKIGTPIAIKTKESLIYDTYISAIKITPKKFVEYTCGSIRVKFIDKLLKERRR